MIKVYAPPEELMVPPLEDIGTYIKACEEYEDSLRAWCKANSRSPEAGEIVSFPVADGSARYMVLKLSPITLIHIPTYDGWHFNYIERLKLEDIMKSLKRNKGLRALFEHV